MEQKLYTASLYAKAIGKSHRTVVRWCASGKLNAFKLGSVWLIRKDEEVENDKRIHV